MNAAALLASLVRLGVVLHADGDALEYDGPASVLTDTTLATITAHKAELMELLTTARRAAPPKPVPSRDRWASCASAVFPYRASTMPPVWKNVTCSLLALDGCQPKPCS